MKEQSVERANATNLQLHRKTLGLIAVHRFARTAAGRMPALRSQKPIYNENRF